jgi:hypothetical protein
MGTPVDGLIAVPSLTPWTLLSCGHVITGIALSETVPCYDCLDSVADGSAMHDYWHPVILTSEHHRA